jgi:hypothetical protein
MEHTNQFLSAKGHLTDEGAALFVDALKLATVTQLPGYLREHVAGCERCMTSVTELYALVRQEDYSSVREHPFFRLEVRNTSSTQVWRAAAAVAAVLTVAAMVYLLVLRGAGERQQERIHATTVSSGDSAAAPASASQGRDSSRHPAIAANFTPNPEYEELVNAGFRSSAFAGAKPVQGAILSPRSVQFSWDVTAGGTLTLVIVDAAGDDVYRATVHTVPHTPKRMLPPGLYYWKVLNRDEAVYFGKFSVRADSHFPIKTKPAQK